MATNFQGGWIEIIGACVRVRKRLDGNVGLFINGSERVLTEPEARSIVHGLMSALGVDIEPPRRGRRLTAVEDRVRDMDQRLTLIENWIRSLPGEERA